MKKFVENLECSMSLVNEISQPKPGPTNNSNERFLVNRIFNFNKAIRNGCKNKFVLIYDNFVLIFFVKHNAKLVGC